MNKLYKECLALFFNRRISQFVESRFLMRIFLTIFALAINFSPSIANSQQNLREQILALANDHGFDVHGANQLDGATIKKLNGDLRSQLERLLYGYNYLIVGEQNGNITKVVIVGLNSPPPKLSEGTVIQTIRKGASHLLDAVVIGPNGWRKNVRLLIDTGAAMIVLPTSMIRQLGFSEEELKWIELQTANGEIEGQSGKLSGLEIDGIVEEEVSVAFVDDERLGGNMLLGMSFLSRFIFTIDDASNALRLEVRENGK